MTFMLIVSAVIASLLIGKFLDLILIKCNRLYNVHDIMYMPHDSAIIIIYPVLLVLDTCELSLCLHLPIAT